MLSLSDNSFCAASDLHLPGLKEHEFGVLADRFREIFSHENATLISAGDISLQGRRQGAKGYMLLDELLPPLVKVIDIRGNHDRHRDDIEAAVEYRKTTDRFTDLNEVDWVELNQKTCIIGDDGYADFRASRATGKNTSAFSFPEFYVGKVSEWPSTQQIEESMRAIADRGTTRLIGILKRAFEQYDEVFLVTHYPPFVEAVYYQGQAASPDQCGPYTNVGLGEQLLMLLREPLYRDKHVTVLCGHTHASVELCMLPNLTVKVLGVVSDEKVPGIMLPETPLIYSRYS